MGQFNIVPDACFDLTHQPIEVVDVCGSLSRRILGCRPAIHGFADLGSLLRLALRIFAVRLSDPHHTLIVTVLAVVEEAVPVADKVDCALPVGG